MMNQKKITTKKFVPFFLSVIKRYYSNYNYSFSILFLYIYIYLFEFVVVVDAAAHPPHRRPDYHKFLPTFPIIRHKINTIKDADNSLI